MSLLRKIQDAAVSSDSPITDLLRNCKVLAVRLGSQELGEWVDRELNGYPDKESLPAYRICKTACAGHFVGPFGTGIKNAEIPPHLVPKEYRELVTKAYLTQPIAAYEELLKSKDTQNATIPWNASLTARLGQGFYEDMNCLSAWQVVPRGVIIGLVDTVRNRVLNFALEIERMAPDAGESTKDKDSGAISEKTVQHVFTTTIYGNVGNIASGNQSVTQTAEIKIAQGDLAALRTQLLGLGFDRNQVTQLEQALATDSEKAPKELGRSTWEWIGGAVSKAGQGALKISASTASSVLAKLISQYLGIHGP